MNFQSLLSNIRIVLVQTSHPGNIGAAARAMKTMGLSDLVLVDPKRFPCAEATARASGAVDVLAQAQVVSHLDEALAECCVVVGSSARHRSIPWPLLPPSSCATELAKGALNSQVALIFGREKSGLSNKELQKCHFHVNIPADEHYSSLNLAAAVQVLCYEYRMACLAMTDKGDIMHGEAFKTDPTLASAAEMERFYVHLQQVLLDIKFLNPKAPKQLMTRFRRFFYRARPEAIELSMLRGVLTAVENRTQNKAEGKELR